MSALLLRADEIEAALAAFDRIERQRDRRDRGRNSAAACLARHNRVVKSAGYHARKRAVGVM